MKIDSVKTFLVNADEGKRSERPRGRNWIFVKIATDTGLTGVGEGGGWPEIVQKGIEELSHFLIGQKKPMRAEDQDLGRAELLEHALQRLLVEERPRRAGIFG